MVQKKYVVALTVEERVALEKLTKTGKTAAYKINHARILLKADINNEEGGWSDREISKALDISISTIERVRKGFVELGLEEAMSRKSPTHTKTRLLDGKQEAHLIALTCGEPPEGQGSWTLRLLAERMVELGYVESISHETVRQVLKKNELKPWLQECWVIPPKENAEFVYHMEDVLDVYTRPYEPNYPVVCFDETSKQLVSEKKVPIPSQPGQPRRYDYEYERNGVCNLFMFSEPLKGWRHVEVTERRTKKDYSHQMKYLVDVCYPDAERVIVIHDNLNTHVPSALYETFEPAEAKRILEGLEIHYTPKHGSWLNMAEIELSVLSRQCLDRRIPNQEILKREVAAWESRRNVQGSTIDWQFTTEDARIKLKRLYPSIIP